MISNAKRKRGDFNINFGKYKGTLLKNIDDPSYLKWCLANLDLIVYLREAIKYQIQRCEKKEKKNPNFKKFFISL